MSAGQREVFLVVVALVFAIVFVFAAMVLTGCQVPLR